MTNCSHCGFEREAEESRCPNCGHGHRALGLGVIVMRTFIIMFVLAMSALGSCIGGLALGASLPQASRGADDFGNAFLIGVVLFVIIGGLWIRYLVGVWRKQP